MLLLKLFLFAKIVPLSYLRILLSFGVILGFQLKVIQIRHKNSSKLPLCVGGGRGGEIVVGLREFFPSNCCAQCKFRWISVQIYVFQIVYATKTILSSWYIFFAKIPKLLVFSENSMLRIHSKLDENSQKLTLCCGSCCNTLSLSGCSIFCTRSRCLKLPGFRRRSLIMIKGFRFFTFGFCFFFWCCWKNGLVFWFKNIFQMNWKIRKKQMLKLLYI